MTSTAGCVAAVQQLAADAGATMLELGGNAVDAAVATAFAQGVVDPYRCGIGGGGMAMVHDPRSGDTTIAKFYGCAPGAATPDMFTPRGHWGTLFMVDDQANQFGYRASVVPALSRGLADLLTRFGSGRISWQQVLEPAISLADDGFVAFPFFVAPMLEPPGDHPFLGVVSRTVVYSEGARAVFAPDGKLPRIGQLFRQPAYAATLRLLAEKGVEEFYSGSIGQAMVAEFAANGGLLSQDDLKSYRTQFTDPIEGSYKNLRILTEPPPSIGPTTLQLLRILEGWDLPALGFNSADYVDTFVRAANLVFQDRLAYIGDPSVVDVPLDMLLSAERAAEHRATVEQARSDPAPKAPVGAVGHGSRDTTHVTAVDEDGTVALITHSVGSGSGVVPSGLGFMMNNHMIQFDPRPGNPNSIAPHKHPNVGGGPMIIFDGADLVLAMGSPAGGVKATAMAQAVVAINDFGFAPAQCAFLDRFHAEDVPMVLTVDPRFEPRAVTELARRGYQLTFTDYSARIAGVSRDPITGSLTGIADPRGDRGIAYVTRKS